MTKIFLLFHEKFISQPNDKKTLPVSKISLFVSQMTKTQDSKKVASPCQTQKKAFSGFWDQRGRGGRAAILNYAFLADFSLPYLIFKTNQGREKLLSLVGLVGMKSHNFFH